jgi:hypothetical protein
MKILPWSVTFLWNVTRFYIVSKWHTSTQTHLIHSPFILWVFSSLFSKVFKTKTKQKKKNFFILYVLYIYYFFSLVFYIIYLYSIIIYSPKILKILFVGYPNIPPMYSLSPLLSYDRHKALCLKTCDVATYCIIDILRYKDIKTYLKMPYKQK